MIQSFADKGTQDIFNGINSKQARKKLDPSLHSIAWRKLDMIDAAHNLNDLKVPPSNHLEGLKGTLQGYYSIRINDQHRIVFSWCKQGSENVETIDYY
jgi:toxin HigB-1